MSRAAVYTEAATGGDRIWLDAIGQIQALRITRSYPGGDIEATWESRIDVRQRHRAWDPGRRVGVCLGASTIWRGKLDTPKRGDVWQFTATGLAADAKSYLAVGANPLALNASVDAAIARGWAVTRGTSLPSLTDGTQPSGSTKLDEALDTVCSAAGVYWKVDHSGVLTAASLPTAVGYQLLATGNGGGRTLDGFITDVYVTYVEKTSNQPATLLRTSTAARKFGHIEDTLDLTGLGPITTGQAQSTGDAYLASHAARTKFAGQFVVTRGQLRTSNGAPVDLALVDPGVLTRIHFTDPESAGELAVGSPQIVMGTTDYDDDADTLTLTPLDAAVSTVPAVLSAGGGSSGTAAASSAAHVLSVASEGVASPWQPVPAASGFTSTVEVRQVGASIEFRGAFSTASGSYPTGNTSTVAAVGANPYPPAVTRIAACGHTFGGGTAVSVCRVNIASNGSITVQNIEQTSVTTVWLDGVHISGT